MNKKLKIHDGDTPGEVIEVKLEYPKPKVAMKCPLCQQELRKIHPTYVICDNCRITGDDELWQELIRTRKALDLAKERLKNTILDAEVLATPEYLASRAKETLDEITALEQKDK